MIYIETKIKKPLHYSINLDNRLDNRLLTINFMKLKGTHQIANIHNNEVEKCKVAACFR